MSIRVATFAVLALLAACGQDEAPKTAPAAGKSTAKAAEPTLVMPKPKEPAPAKSSTVTTPKSTPDGTSPTSGAAYGGTEASSPAPAAPTSTSPTASAAKATPTPPAPPVEPLSDEAGASGVVADGAVPKDEVTADRAVAHLAAVGSSGVSGTITFARVATGLEIHVLLDGLKPGEHGLHVHEKGDCTAMDGSSAGGHFNPRNMPHGGRDSAERHAGDFGNVTADAAGHVDVTFTDTHVALSGEDSILGRAIVVHADRDDGVSQPSGNSGARVGCGVIEAEKGGGEVGG